MIIIGGNYKMYTREESREIIESGDVDGQNSIRAPNTKGLKAGELIHL